MGSEIRLDSEMWYTRTSREQWRLTAEDTSGGLANEERTTAMEKAVPTPDTSDMLLRDVMRSDLPIFFDQQLDPDANHMAAFTAKDPSDRDAFLAHWSRILGDETITIQTILFDGQVAGSVLSYEDEDERPEVSYWIGKPGARGLLPGRSQRFSNTSRCVLCMPALPKTTSPHCASWKNAGSLVLARTRDLPTLAVRRSKNSFCGWTKLHTNTM